MRSNVFNSVFEGAAFLLGDTCRVLNEIGADYVIVGGWTPYLRNQTDIIHPGTRDVDILFKDAYIQDNLAGIISALLGCGFAASAKHDFQLLRTLNVGDHSLVYNIDLLHPSESKKNLEMFVDHFDLGIPSMNGVSAGKMVRSIVIPETDLIFDQMWGNFEFSYNNVGKNNKCIIPLMNHLGLIISKADSFTNAKRRRDSFDLYLTLKQEDFCFSEAVDKVSKKQQAIDILDGLRWRLREDEMTNGNIANFNQNVRRFCDAPDDSPVRFAINKLEEFLKDIPGLAQDGPNKP